MKDRTFTLLEKFVSTLNVEGVCGFWVDEEKDENELYWVYMIIDLDWLEEFTSKPEFVVHRMKIGLREEIKKWLGINVMVGSAVKKCFE